MQPAFFRSRRQYHLFLLLCLSTAFNVLMVLVRMYVIHFDLSNIQSVADLTANRGTTATFLFLVWNLFLAWIPYIIAMGIEKIHSKVGSWTLTSVALLSWLVFFPNAPYIVTDLLHLQDRPYIPYWYDLMLFLSFAWTGLMLGYTSLFEVQRFLQRHFTNWIAWSVSVGAILLGSFGVYLGRYQRWNSWDLVTRPKALIYDMVETIIHPVEAGGTLGICVVLSGFMLLGYLTLSVMQTKE